MKYLVEFKYEVVGGQQMTSWVRSKALDHADEVIKKHLEDKTKPRVIKWRLWKLQKEGVVDGAD